MTTLRENSAAVCTWMLLHLMTMAVYMLSEVSFISLFHPDIIIVIGFFFP